MREFFANGVDKMHVPWAVEGLPTLLHLSLFLFFGGLVIFLLHIDHKVFTYLVWWIGIFSMLYGLITLLPLIRQDSPYYAPLSIPAWFLYASIPYVAFKVLAFITSGSYGSYQTWERCDDLRDRYRGWMLGGVEKKAEETAQEQSSEIDVRILGWTISVLGDDDSLEKFFEAIPGWFNSKLVKHLQRDFPATLLKTFWIALDGFLGRTLSSNSVTESVKSRRIIICRDIMSVIPCLNIYLHDNLYSHFDQAPISIEGLQAMARWFAHLSGDVSEAARIRAAKSLARMQERDGRWIALASDVYGLPKRDLQLHVDLGGDNVLLATLIHVSRRAIHSRELSLVGALTQFGIHRTLPGLQHDFCALWNEMVQEAKNREHDIVPVQILRSICHVYIALHQNTYASWIAFSAFISNFPPIRWEPSSYPLCNIASHRPESTARLNFPAGSIPAANPAQPRPGDSPDALSFSPSHGGSTVPQQGEQANIVVGSPSPSNLTTTDEIGRTAHAPITAPVTVHFSPRPIDVGQTSSTVPKPATVQASPSAAAASTLILSKSLAPGDAGTASTTSKPLFPSLSIVGVAIPPSPPPLPDAEPLILLSGTSLSGPSDNDKLLHLRPRGLVNEGNMCFANAVLQLLVYCPPFWDLFRDLARQMGQRGRSVTGGGATPLVDATVRFFEEFMSKEKEPPSTQQLPQQAERGKLMEDEERKKEHDAVDSFNPRYLYDAMKEKRRLINLLVRSRDRAAPFCC
jgi:hypothetical protein